MKTRLPATRPSTPSGPVRQWRRVVLRARLNVSLRVWNAKSPSIGGCATDVSYSKPHGEHDVTFNL